MNTKELTSGNSFKLIILFMIPIFIGNLFQQFYNFFDALIVSRFLGIKALASVGATTALIFLVISFIFASTQGFTIITAQKFGAKDYNMVRKSFVIGLILSFWLTLILTLISTPFTTNLLQLLRTPADIFVDAEKYLFIMCAGIFATVFYNLSSNTIRALGNSKVPLYFLIFATILNIVLDILFVVNFGWGIEGAGWATVISQAVATVGCMFYMFWKFPILRFKKEDWHVSKDFLYEHIKIGIPMGVQMSVLALGMIVLQWVLNSFGSDAVAGYTTAMRIDQLFSQCFLALGATMSVFAAQNYGAKKMSRIREGAKYAIFIAVLICAVSIIVLNLFSENIIAIFMTEINIEVMKYAQEYLHIIVIFFICLALLLIFRNILQGMGNVVAPLISSFTELVARGSFAVIFGHYFGFTGICTATPAAWLSGAIILFICYKISLIKFVKTNK